MKTLPLLISVPHGGLSVPPEVEDLNLLSPREIGLDGDVGAERIYSRLKKHVRHYVTTDIARAFVDLNRAEDDIRKDGVVKTHTCWDIPIYKRPLTADIIHRMIAAHHRPYHRRLTDLARKEVLLAVDCHTMADTGPPVGPDPGRKRPEVCLGNLNHTSCPEEWMALLADCFGRFFKGEIRINKPFAGGWITRSQSRNMPWVQLELSRSPHLTDDEKGEKVLKALSLWCDRLPQNSH